MRQLLTFSVIILLLVSLCFFTHYYTDNVLYSAAEKASLLSSPAEVSALKEEWESVSQIAELFIDHAELEEVSHLLWQMEAELAYDIDEFVESRDTLHEMILHICSRYKLSLINVL